MINRWRLRVAHPGGASGVRRAGIKVVADFFASSYPDVHVQTEVLRRRFLDQVLWQRMEDHHGGLGQEEEVTSLTPLAVRCSFTDQNQITACFNAVCMLWMWCYIIINLYIPLNWFLKTSHLCQTTIRTRWRSFKTENAAVTWVEPKPPPLPLRLLRNLKASSASSMRPSLTSVSRAYPVASSVNKAFWLSGQWSRPERQTLRTAPTRLMESWRRGSGGVYLQRRPSSGMIKGWSAEASAAERLRTRRWPPCTAACDWSLWLSLDILLSSTWLTGRKARLVKVL